MHRADGGRTSLTNPGDGLHPARDATFFEWLDCRPVGGLVTYAGIPYQRMLIALASELPNN